MHIEAREDSAVSICIFERSCWCLPCRPRSRGVCSALVPMLLVATRQVTIARNRKSRYVESGDLPQRQVSLKSTELNQRSISGLESQILKKKIADDLSAILNLNREVRLYDTDLHPGKVSIG